MQRAELPVRKDLIYGADQEHEKINLVNSLVYQCSSTLPRPASLYRPAVIFSRSVPLYVCVCLKNLSKAPIEQSLLQKEYRVVKTVLTHDPQLFDHPLQIFDGWNLSLQRFGEFAGDAVCRDTDRLDDVLQRVLHDGTAPTFAEQDADARTIDRSALGAIHRGQA